MTVLHEESIVMSKKNSSALPPSDLNQAGIKYLAHVIESNLQLQLQGLQSAGDPVPVRLENVYVPLHTAVEDKQLTGKTGSSVKASAREAAPENPETNIRRALSEYRHLVVVGDPGCGKTILLRYLALTYARDLLENHSLVKERLGLDEARWPILLSLREFARYLEFSHGCFENYSAKDLLNYLQNYCDRQKIDLPERFFEQLLEKGNCALLLDGLDEVTDLSLRRCVAATIEAFTRTYPDNRYVVTSRMVGYTVSAGLQLDYTVVGLRQFDRKDIECFIKQWSIAVEIAAMGAISHVSQKEAERQSKTLLAAIEKNERLREMAVNPLLLTVIALVQRCTGGLPERRVELYREAVELLLRKRDDAGKFISVQGNCHAFLDFTALKMMESGLRSIDEQTLQNYCREYVRSAPGGNWNETKEDCLLTFTIERSGLLVKKKEGGYGFSHLSFQDYMASRAIFKRSDCVRYAIAHAADQNWREVVLLLAGRLWKDDRPAFDELIRKIMKCKKGPEPFYNLVLAADCLRDAGRTGNDVLWGKVRHRLKTTFKRPLSKDGRFGRVYRYVYRGPTMAEMIYGRALAARALARMESNTPGTHPAFWRVPWGEPEWVNVPAGKFYMADGDAQYQLSLEKFKMAKVPVTNAQYQIFIRDTGHRAPKYWIDKRPPQGVKGHPVVNVSWHDAMAYCKWLSAKTGKSITLPSEAQWEKAARGKHKNIYPWGNKWCPNFCNNSELGIGQTTPVGIFPNGASHYGCLDMAGNVWEWTCSLWKNDRTDGLCKDLNYPEPSTENITVDHRNHRVMRGGSWDLSQESLRCSFRLKGFADNWGDYFGFRVACPPTKA